MTWYNPGTWYNQGNSSSGSNSNLDAKLQDSEQRPKSAFTLVELLVVTGIISLLAALTLPALKGARENAKRKVCVSNLRQVGIADAIYADAYDERWPRNSAATSNVGWDTISPIQDGLIYSEKIFPITSGISYCPSDKINKKNDPNNGIQNFFDPTKSVRFSYFNWGSSIGGNYKRSTDVELLLADRHFPITNVGNHPSAGNALRSDGSVIGFEGCPFQITDPNFWNYIRQK